ncbi:MAG: hypothetical protein GKS02_00450 [Alphaproteobacteria bacterium]|nr:hypothetical protein [Alphaproteobacteria bacterium]
MQDDTEASQPRKRALGAELVIPVAALAFTIYYFYTILEAPWTAQASAFFIGTILIILSLVFIGLTFRWVAKGEGDWSFHTLFEPHEYVKLRLALFALTVGYIAVISFLGFTITTFLFLVLAMLLLNRGRRAKLCLSLSAILSVGGYLLFVVAFDTNFPEGPFEILMNGIL